MRKLTLLFSAMSCIGLIFAGCEEDNKPGGNHDDGIEIKVQDVAWKSDLKNGIERSLGDHSLNVANRMNINPENATNQHQTFTSSSPGVATVSEYGQVMTLALGSTTITVTVDGLSDSFTLRVVEQALPPVIPVEEISISNSEVSLAAGSTKDLKTLFTVLPSSATDKSVTYVSDNESFVTVSATGVITGVTEGTAKVTVTSNANNSIYKEFNVTVTPFYGDYEPRSAWTVENMYPALFGGEAAAIIEGMFDNNFSTWVSFVKPGQSHSGSGHTPVANPAFPTGYIEFTVDMKAPKLVNYFRIRWRNANDLGMRFSKFETISGSNDNINFDLIASDVEITNAGTAAEILSPNISIPPSTYRYIKFYVGNTGCFVNFGTNKTVSINELYFGRAQ